MAVVIPAKKGLGINPMSLFQLAMQFDSQETAQQEHKLKMNKLYGPEAMEKTELELRNARQTNLLNQQKIKREDFQIQVDKRATATGLISDQKKVLQKTITELTGVIESSPDRNDPKMEPLYKDLYEARTAMSQANRQLATLNMPNASPQQVNQFVQAVDTQNAMLKVRSELTGQENEAFTLLKSNLKPEFIPGLLAANQTQKILDYSANITPDMLRDPDLWPTVNTLLDPDAKKLLRSTPEGKQIWNNSILNILQEQLGQETPRTVTKKGILGDKQVTQSQEQTRTDVERGRITKENAASVGVSELPEGPGTATPGAHSFFGGAFVPEKDLSLEDLTAEERAIFDAEVEKIRRGQ